MTKAFLALSWACALLCIADGAFARGAFIGGVRYRNNNLAPGFFIATAANGGSDSNPGTLAAPFATLTAARTAMRNSTTKKTTYIRAGTYNVTGAASDCDGTAAIQLQSQDTGTTWSDYPPDGPGTAIIDGGSTSPTTGIFNGFCINGTNGATINGLQIQRFIQTLIQVYDPNVVIKNNTLHDYTNHSNNGAVNIGGATAQNAQVLNNYIYSTPERGISIGPCFQAGCGGGTNNALVSGNYIQNSCQQEPDCGGIYIVDFQSPRSTNMRILNNYIRDSYISSSGGRGIYLDDGASGVTVSGNIVIGAGTTCYNIHAGWHNTYTGNLCDLAAVSSTNILLSQNGDQGSGGNNGPGNSFSNNIIIAGMSGSGGGYGGDTTSPITYDHIVIVVEENHAYSEIVGDTTDAPYINNTLIADGALMSNYKAITHPSEPNYFALYAGSTFGITDDGDYSEPDPSLYTVLNAAGKTFTGYIETASPRKHNPWESFPEGVTVEKDFSQFPTDFSTLPNVSFVIPDLNDDMHDGTIADGDAWLQNNIAAYETWAKTHNSLLIVTWDEDDSSGTNQVPTIFVGDGVVHGTYATAANHYSLLRMIATSMGVTAPRNGATASQITTPFASTVPAVQNNFYHNYVGASVNSGGAFSDSHAVTGDPLINGWTYTISGASPVFNSPVSFPGLPSSWGPPGFVVPQVGTAPSNPH